MVDHYSRPGSVLAAVMFGCCWACIQLFGALGTLVLLPCSLLLAIGSLLLFVGITRWVYVAAVVIELVLVSTYLVLPESAGWVTVMLMGPVIGVVFALVPATGRWLPPGR
ncbi:hypothetical protein [Kibdelosporangium aridum]|uniref:Uncharacterized protein n=1 Tax=Kibdelosporangium aridum TaxID=2030 RepID=A0A1W2EJN6_KIBAR|nr:hypothetical protein [Kibdelosporangium aridum]SMD09368.1 hypothetical protein SAMN05661093_04423 [Kibdelosporangium aridum]